MSFQERVYSVLIVSAAEKFNLSLRALLPDFRFSPVRFESSVNAAKRILLERNFDFVMINSPLPDEDGLRFAIDLCREKDKVALLFVREELYTATYARTAEHGVFLLSKPVSRGMAAQAIDWMIATRERLKKLEEKTVSMEEKLLEIRTVNRAKWLLINELKMTEADAHRYIEKQAMDSCVSKKTIAETIIRTYS